MVKKLMILCALFAFSGIYGAENLAKALQKDFTEVAKNAIPAVVSIQVKSNAKNKNSFRQGDSYQYNYPFGLFDDDFLRQFFGGQPETQKSVLAQGSGFIISSEGLILTNNHLVSNTSDIRVFLNDGREFPATVIGKDDNTDVALIKIDAKDLPFLKLGDSNKLEVGQWAIAIGTPYGLQATFTVGVVSAKGRNDLDIAKVEDFIQTDAAINQGNSGGPLLDIDGNVIGINTAIASNHGGYIGIGFAVPSNIAKTIMEQLEKNGKVTRGFLGISMQKVDSDLAHAFDLPKAEGALVADIIKGSAADKAGLKQGDVILKYGDIPVENIGSFRNAIALMEPGSKITLTVIRDKKLMQLPIEIGQFQDNENVIGSANNFLGIEVANLTPEIMQKLNIPDAKGVVITKVDVNGTGAIAGLKQGAVVLSINKAEVNSVDDFNRLLGALEDGKPVLLLVKQGSVMRFFSIRKG